MIDPYLDNRLRSDKPITFLQFMDDLRVMWESAGKTGRIIRKVPFDQEMEFPLITFKTIRRLINDKFKDMKPRHRATIRHPYIPDTFVELRGQMFDIWVEYQVYSKSQEEADFLVEELDDFIQAYKGTFKKNGVQEITFYAQGEDEVLTDYRFPVAVRTLQYTLRFEKITPVFLNQYELISTQVNILQPQEE